MSTIAKVSCLKNSQPDQISAYLYCESNSYKPDGLIVIQLILTKYKSNNYQSYTHHQFEFQKGSKIEFHIEFYFQ